MARAVSSMGEESFIVKVEAVHRTARFAIFVRGRLRSIAPSFGSRWLLAQGMNDEADHCDANAGIGDIEGGPRIGKANVQVEEKKIGDVTVDEPVGEVAHDAGEKQSEGKIAPGIWTTLFAQKNGKHRNQCDQRQDNEKGVVVLERTESRAGVGNVHEIEPPWNDREIRVRIDVSQDPIFCDLIERVEGQGKRQDPIHTAPKCMSSRANARDLSDAG